jgi:hypothetical protein
MTEAELLREACSLLQDCFRSLGDPDGFKRAAPQELWEWWSERTRKRSRKPTGIKARVLDMNNPADVAEMAAARAKRAGS